MDVITGCTGFVGKELLARLLADSRQKRVAVIVRPSANRSADDRVQDILAEVAGPSGPEKYRGRIEVHAGDISLPHFGLGEGTFTRLALSTSSIYHSAATTTLNHPLEEARAINVKGTASALELARIARKNNPDIRLNHISTAFVAGATDKTVRASQLDTSGAFRNSYEQTKAEAEALVRGAAHDVQSTIFRPSAIVGDSVTGKTSAFNVVYIPARLVILGLCKAVPAIPHAPFDIVPVDYVADAIIHLSKDPRAIGGCYHLSAGLGRESSPREILDTLLMAFDRARSSRPSHLERPRFIAPDLLIKSFSSLSAAAQSMKLLERKVTEHLAVFSQMVPFIPYMLSNPRFDTEETVRDLAPVLGHPPLFKHYAERVFGYCFQTNWGKRPHLAAIV